jgi:hypothetical protein
MRTRVVYVLVLSILAFAFLVPIVPVKSSCGYPISTGCGGPQYDSVTYFILGVGETIAFVGPDTPYNSVAILITILFLSGVAYALYSIIRQQRKA